MKLRENLQQTAFRTLTGALIAWEKLESGVTWNPAAARFVEDPYPFYRALREKDPVHRSRLTGGWGFTRYADVLELLSDSRLSSDFRNQSRWPRIKKALLRAGRTAEEIEQPTMLNSDPPRHTRLRGLVSKAFTPRAVRALEGRMRETVDELLAAKAGASELDVIADLAYPLPVIVIAEMLGIPAEDRERFKHWSDEAVRSLGTPNPEDLRASLRAVRELNAYLKPIAEAIEDTLSPFEPVIDTLLTPLPGVDVFLDDPTLIGLINFVARLTGNEEVPAEFFRAAQAALDMASQVNAMLHGNAHHHRRDESRQMPARGGRSSRGLHH